MQAELCLAPSGRDLASVETCPGRVHAPFFSPKHKSNCRTRMGGAFDSSNARLSRVKPSSTLWLGTGTGATMRIRSVKQESKFLFERYQKKWLALASADLSPHLRYQLLWLASGQAGKNFASDVARKCNVSDRTALKALHNDGLRKSAVFGGAVALLNESRSVDAQLNEGLVFSTNFGNREALHNFMLWLQGVPQFGDGLALWPGRKEFAEAGRANEIAAVRTFLDARKGREGKPPILVVHADGMARGLTALASDVIHSGEFDTSPICYLPVSRMAAMPDIVDAPRLVGWLHNFYHGRPTSDEAGPQGAASEAGFIEMVDDIRREMARKPAIIILDGHVDRAGSTSALRNLIVDDPVAGVLDLLVQPHGGSVSDPVDISTFENTCFLVLADGPSLSLSPYCSERIRLPSPRLDDTLRFVEESDVQGRLFFDQHDAVAEFCRRTGSADELEMHLVDVMAALDIPIGDIPGGQPEVLVSRFLDFLRRQNTRAYLILTWLALTPGGLRHASLHRLLRRWARIYPPGKATYKAFGSSPTTVEKDVSDMEGWLDGLFILVEDRTLPATVLRDHRLEDLDAEPTSPISDPKDSSRQTITFRLPKMRRLFLEGILRDEEAHDAVGAMHFLLSEESLRQHTMLMRHADRMDFSSMRANRRLAQALYHGFLSLRALDETREIVAKSVPCVMPAPRQRAFMRLYAVFYRNLLEAPPHWEVSRVMSAEAVKCDLLLLALNAISDDVAHWRGSMLDEAVGPPSLPNWITAAATVKDLPTGEVARF